MMKIDLKWGLPFVMPFVLLGFIRLFWFAAGADWSEPWIAALFLVFFGFAAGVAATITLHHENIKWTVRIGPRKDTP